MSRLHIKLISSLALMMPTLLFAGTVTGPWSLSGSLDGTSDYRLRGISQTYKLPGVQGEFDLVHSSGFYVSTAGQNVSGNQYVGGNSMEWDFWSGYKFEIARELPIDFGIFQFYYDGAKVPLQNAPAGSAVKLFNYGRNYDTTELYFDTSYLGFTAKVNYALTDEFGVQDINGGSSKHSWYADLTYNHDLSKELHTVFHVGHQMIRGVYLDKRSYTDYKIGVSADAFNLNWMLAIVGTNANKAAYTVENLNDGTSKVLSSNGVVATVSRSF